MGWFLLAVYIVGFLLTYYSVYEDVQENDFNSAMVFACLMWPIAAAVSIVINVYKLFDKAASFITKLFN